ncbi:aquaporin [Spiroplasma alleghenense]|uniref:aquaporin n=1 Tax=Spiroplasma alleghenense TaxID=216931 RepID=UPI000E1E3943
MWVSLLITEFLGTAILVILGNGIVANVLLKNTKGNNAGWLSITIGWGVAVTVAAMISSAFEGGAGYLNPAVALAMAISNFQGSFANIAGSTAAGVGVFFLVILIEILGAMVGQIVVNLVYFKHIKMTLTAEEKDAAAKVLAIHSTGPTTRSCLFNFIAEFVGTTVLVIGILAMSKYKGVTDLVGPMMAGLIVLGVGLALGGTTGYAINPARDLGPRIIHSLMRLKDKGTSDWGYSWIPVLAPLSAGAVIGAIFLAL